MATLCVQGALHSLSGSVLFDLHNDVTWVQACKDGYSHVMEEDPRAHSEEESPAQVRVAHQLRSFPLQLPASNQSHGCPSPGEERSGLPKAAASQSTAVSPSRSSNRVDGANVQSWPQDLSSRPQGGLPCPHSWSGFSLLENRESSFPSQRCGRCGGPGERAVGSHGDQQSCRTDWPLCQTPST